MRRRSGRMRCVAKLAPLCAVLLLSGCVTAAVPVADPFAPEEPYLVLPVDESMSCAAIAASFRFSARRAARLEYWLASGPIPGFGYARYEIDAPAKLHDEFRRMDALSDLQRYKGCRVMEPQAAVAYERARLEPIPQPPAVVHAKG